MKIITSLATALLICGYLSATSASAQTTNAVSSSVTAVLPKTVAPADVPSPNHPTGLRHMTSIHQKFLQRIQQDNKIQLLFLGDSITANWNRPENQATWNKYFGQYDPANFGDGGDYTEHLLWRIDNGELDGISPKVVVLLIGVNNIYHNPGNTPEETAAGVKKILDTIHEKLPQTRVILLGLFPYNRGPGSLEKAQAVNSIISKFDDGQKTRYLSIWDQFLVGGAVTKDHTMDLLHPNASGYQIWADTMQPLLEELMK